MHSEAVEEGAGPSFKVEELASIKKFLSQASSEANRNSHWDDWAKATVMKGTSKSRWQPNSSKPGVEVQRLGPCSCGVAGGHRSSSSTAAEDRCDGCREAKDLRYHQGRLHTGCCRYPECDGFFCESTTNLLSPTNSTHQMAEGIVHHRTLPVDRE